MAYQQAAPGDAAIRAHLSGARQGQAAGPVIDLTLSHSGARCLLHTCTSPVARDPTTSAVHGLNRAPARHRSMGL